MGKGTLHFDFSPIHFHFSLFVRWFILRCFFFKKIFFPSFPNHPSNAFLYFFNRFFPFQQRIKTIHRFTYDFYSRPHENCLSAQIFFLHFHSSIYIIRAHFKDKRFKITASEFDVCFFLSSHFDFFFLAHSPNKKDKK